MPKDKTSTEVAVVKDTLPAGVTQEELDALLNQQESEIDDDFVQTPIFKIGQSLTREVQEGEAEAGEFIDTLRGEGVGDKIGFIVAYYQKGRFAADRETGKAYVSFGDTIPANWADLVGEEWVGTPFVEHPDAEETYKERVNRKEIEWGKGPLISTTHNFTGFAVVSGVGDEPDELRPARLSLQRTNMPAVRKWMTLKRSTLRSKPFWDLVFDLGTEKKSYSRGVAYNLKVGVGRPTTADERAEAVELARLVASGRVVDNAGDAADDSAPSPVDNGGLAV